MRKEDFVHELRQNILPFWMDRMTDRQHGGFYGRIDGKGILHPEAPKGAVLNARILWTFAAAYRAFGEPAYRETAERAFIYLRDHFIDPVYGGIYWELESTGKPQNRKKHLYAQAFAIYGLSEYYRVTGCPEALEMAKELFRLIESRRDHTAGGYPEAFTESWNPISDMRLSDKDLNTEKTHNTHLHILEAYTNLIRVWNDETLKATQRELIGLFTGHFFNPATGHMNLFFDRSWNPVSELVSYGHDIETAWLLIEAAEVLGDAELLERVIPLALRTAEGSVEGIETDGSMIYEKEGSRIDRDRHWWVQAEAVVGFAVTARYSGEQRYLDLSEKAWDYIRKQLIDPHEGEWYWSIRGDGTVNSRDDKAGFWKCPYHNSRMCLELIHLEDPS